MTLVSRKKLTSLKIYNNFPPGTKNIGYAILDTGEKNEKK